MPKAPILSLAILSSLVPPLLAQDGGQLYSLYCSACHGTDGKGATGGAFPPLAGSPWVEGEPKRSVAIVLKGLHGPIEVNGKGYNLEMPPQGATLTDPHIAAILTYVHSAWGNKGEKVSVDLVKASREELKNRDKPWTAPEILKLFPLPEKETALKNLTSRLYKGKWNKLPDFEKLTAENIEEEHNGILTTAVSPIRDSYGIVWEGDFIAPADGTYEFFLDADDGARLLIDKQPVSTVDGIGPLNGSRASKGKATLKKGANPIRIEYYEVGGNEGIALAWKASGAKDWIWLSDHSDTGKQDWPNIPLTPAEGKTVIYRNFIGGTTPRAIAFGFPGGINLAYSADNLAPELIWTGDFIDAGRHWTNRGQGNQNPAGEKITKLTTARFLPPEARFKGYQLDSNGNPTFNIQIGSQLLTDTWKPGETNTLLRTLTLTGGSQPLEIPLGNPALTGSEKTTLTPAQPVTIPYKLQ